MEKCRKLRISFEEVCTECIAVTPLENNLYRLDATPLLARICVDDLEVSFGDVIEVEAQDNVRLCFVRVVQRSAWRHWDWLLSKETIESVQFQAFQQAIEAHDGAWERLFGGVFLVHLPPESDFDPEAAFELAVAQRRREGNMPE